MITGVAWFDENANGQRDDSENTGVYFLFGKNEENNDTVYISCTEYTEDLD